MLFRSSHEMQTPVAILKSNLEMLMQSENLNEKDITYIEGIESGISKLSKLNSSLLLLAKIENNQFNVKSIINIRTVIRQVLQQYEVEIDAKNILIINQLNYDFNIVMEPNLAEILFRNLISNAIQYNINHGKIFLDFNENTFTIKNTGNPIDFNSTEIFSRFKKGNTSIQSTGLGLSIVKSIALCHGFIIDYGYENKLHIFNLILKKP